MLELPILQTIMMLDEACQSALHVAMFWKWTLAEKVKECKQPQRLSVVVLD